MSEAKAFIMPSILAADFAILGQQIRTIEENGVTNLHFDVMDGSFVPQISFGTPVLKSIRKITNLSLDAHLMIDNPIKHIKDYAEAGADLITFHYEATDVPKREIEEIRKYEKKVGISIKPATPFEAVKDYLKDIDLLLIMTVEPGYGGQKIIPETIEKIKNARRFVLENNLDCIIQIDGGVTRDNVAKLVSSGAQGIVAGTAVFGGDIASNIEKIKEEIADAGVGY